jgi:hypothetical protein
MGISRRYDDMVAASARARRDQEAVAEATAAVAAFNARAAVGKTIWSWPTVGAALVSQHHWLTIVCEACDMVTDMDLTFKRRNPDDAVRVALHDVKCPRCNGHGRPRIIALGLLPSR